jgi:hypothetical protein
VLAHADSLTRSAISACGLVGEGDGEDASRARTFFVLDEPGDAIGDDACLAGTGAGEDEQRTLRGLDGSALLGIEMGEKGVQGVDSGEKVPESSVSFGRRAVNDARFESPKRLSRSQLGARQEQGYSAPAGNSGHGNRKKHRTSKVFFGPLPRVVTRGSEDG